VNLSGGEKRRITLARSMLRETPILILDEPLANLDEKNAKSIEQQLISIKDRTLIIISHQFTEMNSFDEVYVFS
jgi:ABC-type multidrug transport system fused ATPase/permease subunit